MKNLCSKRTYLILVLLGGLTLSACQKDQHVNGSPLVQPAATLPKAGENCNNADGTACPGGGNGLKNRALESYRIDPTETDAYKKILKTRFESIGNLPSNEETHKATSSFFNSKNWYVAPVSLKTLDNKTLGLSFTKENTQQLAAQTEREIWIDKDIFEKMSLEDQATLIVHEYMMMLYLLKFESGDELCKRVFLPLYSVYTDFNNNMTCETLQKISPWLMGPASESIRELNQTDYASIRQATSYILSAEVPMNQNSLNTKLLSLDFDSRLFGHNGSNEVENSTSTPFQSDSQKLTAKRLSFFTDKLQALHFPLTKCHFFKMKKTESCTVQIEKAEKTNRYQAKHPGLIIKIKTQSGYQAEYTINDEIYDGVSAFSVSSPENLNRRFYHFPVSLQNDVKAELGALYYSVEIIVSQASWHSKQDISDENTLLEGIVLIPQIVTKVTPFDSDHQHCNWNADVAPQSFATDVIMIGRDVEVVKNENNRLTNIGQEGNGPCYDKVD